MSAFVSERETPQAVGARIAELRKEKSWTQKDLAEQIGVARSLVAQWEAGNRLPDVESWLKLADVFDVSTDYICGTSKSRTMKGASTSDHMDLNKLNSLGKHMLFEYYHMLIKNEEFRIEISDK